MTLSDGESFTWDQLDPDRHYRVIEVGPAVTEPPGPAAPGEDDSGEPPPGWELTGFECDSVGATLFGADDNSIAGRLNETTAEGVTDPGWAACNVTHFRLSDPRASPEHDHGAKVGRSRSQRHQPATERRHHGPLEGRRRRGVRAGHPG